MTPAAITCANDQTRAVLKARMAEQHIPALQVAVVVHGRVVMSEAYGVANVEQQIAVTRQTLFPMALSDQRGIARPALVAGAHETKIESKTI